MKQATDLKDLKPDMQAKRIADLGWRAAKPPGGRRGEPVTKRKKRRWSGASKPVSTSKRCFTEVLAAVYLHVCPLQLVSGPYEGCKTSQLFLDVSCPWACPKNYIAPSRAWCKKSSAFNASPRLHQSAKLLKPLMHSQIIQHHSSGQGQPVIEFECLG